MSLIKRIPARALDTLKGFLNSRIKEMPEEMDFCESDCRKTECLEDDFANCTRRRNAVEQRRAFEQAARSAAEQPSKDVESGLASAPRAN